MIVKVKYPYGICIYDIEQGICQNVVDGELKPEVIQHSHTLESLMKLENGEVIYMNAGTTHPKEKAEPITEG